MYIVRDGELGEPLESIWRRCHHMSVPVCLSVCLNEEHAELGQRHFNNLGK